MNALQGDRETFPSGTNTEFLKVTEEDKMKVLGELVSKHVGSTKLKEQKFAKQGVHS